MPDWISHVMLALIITEVGKIKKKGLVVLGALLPDFLVKINVFSTFTNFSFTEIDWFLAPLHLPIGTFLSIFIIAPLFKEEYNRVVSLIGLGALSHYIADATIKTLLTHNQSMLLFPFSWEIFQLNLLWANQWYIFMFTSVLIYILLKVKKQLSFKKLS